MRFLRHIALVLPVALLCCRLQAANHTFQQHFFITWTNNLELDDDAIPVKAEIMYLSRTGLTAFSRTMYAPISDISAVIRFPTITATSDTIGYEISLGEPCVVWIYIPELEMLLPFFLELDNNAFGTVSPAGNVEFVFIGRFHLRPAF